MTNSNGTLLTSEQYAACEQISQSDKSPDSQRAQVLLALNEGVSQAKAGEQAGMTIGQVRYCLKLFRENGTGIFSAPEQTAEIESKADGQSASNDASSDGGAFQINETSANKKKDKKKKDKKKKDKKKKDKKKKGKSKKSKKEKK